MDVADVQFRHTLHSEHCLVGAKTRRSRLCRTGGAGIRRVCRSNKWSKCQTCPSVRSIRWLARPSTPRTRRQLIAAALGSSSSSFATHLSPSFGRTAAEEEEGDLEDEGRREEKLFLLLLSSVFRPRVLIFSPLPPSPSSSPSSVGHRRDEASP